MNGTCNPSHCEVLNEYYSYEYMSLVCKVFCSSETDFKFTVSVSFVIKVVSTFHTDLFWDVDIRIYLIDE